MFHMCMKCVNNWIGQLRLQDGLALFVIAGTQAKLHSYNLLALCIIQARLLPKFSSDFRGFQTD